MKKHKARLVCKHFRAYYAFQKAKSINHDRKFAVIETNQSKTLRDMSFCKRLPLTKTNDVKLKNEVDLCFLM